MTWNANKPANNESPALAPQQIRTNWSRLQSIITADHLFSTTSDASEGFHKLTRWVNQAGTLGDGNPAPVPGTGQFYTKTVTTTGVMASTAGDGEHMMFQRGTGGGSLQEACLTACPVRAAVNFVGRTTNGTCTINWAFNVSSVDRTAQGKYTVNFSVNMPSIYYVPQVIAGRTGSDNAINPQMQGAYADSFSISNYKFVCNRTSSSTFEDPTQACCVIIFGG